MLHSSASSLPGAASNAKALLSTSNSSKPDQSSPDVAQSQAQSQSSTHFGSDRLHSAQLTQQSSKSIGDSWVGLEKKTAGDSWVSLEKKTAGDSWVSLEKKTASYDAQHAAAYSLLCDPRKPTGRRDSDQPSSSNMDSVPEITGEDQGEEEEMHQSNMQSLIQKAKALQVRGRMGCMMTFSTLLFSLCVPSGEMTANSQGN